ncbi:hypothetical protein ZWY2020_022362 [Hordeum vulgare]|nr:hypothetical protein ZWY2020_022362 [Hordeum vulgare]
MSADFGKAFDSLPVIIVVVTVLGILGSVATAYFVYRYFEKNGLPTINISAGPAPAVAGSTTLYAVVPDSQIRDATVERFLRRSPARSPSGSPRSSCRASPTTTPPGSVPAASPFTRACYQTASRSP